MARQTIRLLAAAAALASTDFAVGKPVKAITSTYYPNSVDCTEEKGSIFYTVLDLCYRDSQGFLLYESVDPADASKGYIRTRYTDSDCTTPVDPDQVESVTTAGLGCDAGTRFVNGTEVNDGTSTGVSITTVDTDDIFAIFNLKGTPKVEDPCSVLVPGRELAQVWAKMGDVDQDVSWIAAGCLHGGEQESLLVKAGNPGQIAYFNTSNACAGTPVMGPARCLWGPAGSGSPLGDEYGYVLLSGPELVNDRLGESPTVSDAARGQRFWLTTAQTALLTLAVAQCA